MHHYSFIAYISLALGTRWTVSGSNFEQHIGMLIVGLAVAYLLWIYVEIYRFYEGYRLASLAGDLKDIPAYYRLRRLVTGDYEPISVSCFWVAEIDSPGSGGRAKVVGCVALGKNNSF
jgi:hypothetical protein